MTDQDRWIVCPECGSDDAHHETNPTYSYNGEHEVYDGDGHELMCPDCGENTRFGRWAI